MRILLVNPPVYDFAAYDLWMKPLGLLYIAAILKQQGHNISLLDCMDRSHPILAQEGTRKARPGNIKRELFGCGEYVSAEIPKPAVLSSVPRRYKRFGIPHGFVRKALQKMPRPDIVLVTSGMTYWYPGVQEIIAAVKELFSGVSVVLGGTYATLCPEHAQMHSGADMVVPEGQGALYAAATAGSGLPDLVRELLERLDDFSHFPPPDYSQYRDREYVAIRATRGCPHKCSYCAIGALAPEGFQKKSPEAVAGEIEFFWQQGVRNIAFYDDALLYDAESSILPILAILKHKGVAAQYHSPNGLHARYVSPSVARAMRQAGFVLPRISLETADQSRQERMGGKVRSEDFSAAVNYMREAGYRPGQYAAYIMIGLPGQTIEEISGTIVFAHRHGARILIAEYSPIPGTAEWDTARALVPSPDPLWQNKSLYSLYPLAQWPQFQRMKDLAHTLNRQLLHDAVNAG